MRDEYYLGLYHGVLARGDALSESYQEHKRTSVEFTALKDGTRQVDKDFFISTLENVYDALTDDHMLEEAEDILVLIQSEVTEIVNSK